MPDLLVTPLAEYDFFGHIGLAGHELLLDDASADEVGEFIDDLPIAPPPARFGARWYSLVRFQASWSERWWESMRWERVRSWDVA